MLLWGNMKVNVYDGHYLLHRILHIGSFQGLKTSTGFMTGGLFGVLKTITKLSQEFCPNRIVVCWDYGHSVRRKQILPTYKADRKVDKATLTPEEIYEHDMYWELFNNSLQLCEVLLPVMGIKTIRLPHKEADDLCCLVRFLHPEDEVLLVTDDSDYYQLIDEGCSVYRPINEKMITHENLRETTGFKNSFEPILFKAIIGGHDNLPGISGVGSGTVADAIGKFNQTLSRENVEAFLDFCKSSTSNRIKKIGEHTEQIFRNLLIADIKAEEFTPQEVEKVQGVVSDVTVRYQSLDALSLLAKYELKSLEQSSRYWEPIFEHLT